MEYLEATGRTYFEDMIAGEQTAEVRVVLQTENFIAIVPFASQVPYFVVVLPLTRLPRFEDIESGMLDEFNLVVLSCCMHLSLFCQASPIILFSTPVL